MSPPQRRKKRQMAQATLSCLFEAIHLVRWGVCYLEQYNQENEEWLPKNGGHPSKFKNWIYKFVFVILSD